LYNLLIGGAAGQGVDTMTAIIERILKRSGYYVFTTRDLMSRIRGGHNFSLLRFGNKPITSHSYSLDGIIALNDETLELHKEKLRSDVRSFILGDTKLISDDSRLIKVALVGIAKELGNPVVLGSVALGAVLKLFGEGIENCEDILKLFVKSEYIDVNKKAFQAGYNAVEARFEHLPGAEAQGIDDMALITGSKAVALGAIAAGLKFYSAYPMSPATAIMEYLASKMLECEIVVEQAEDEIAAINMAIGASYAGAVAMTGTSGGGFSLMVEALGLSGMAEIPLVVVNVQRPGPTTGLPTRTEQSDLKFVVSASQGEFPRMVIAVRNQEDSFYQTIRAFHIAEKYQMPVIILSDQYIGDSSATIKAYDVKQFVSAVANSGASDLGCECDDSYLRYRLTENGISPRLFPGNGSCLVTSDSDEHDENGSITESAVVRTQMMDKRMHKLKLIEPDLMEPEFMGAEDFETLLVGWGSTWGPIKEAIEVLNSTGDKRFGALLFGDVFPVPLKKIKELSIRAKQIVNIEQNATGQFGGMLREYAGVEFSSSILKYDGRQISAEEIVSKVQKGEWS